jgi:hypothetical protein
MVGKRLTKDIMPLMIDVMSNDAFVGAWAVKAGEMVELRILQRLLRVSTRYEE